jgi:lipopolysaccharide transport system ATP-binding protein
VDDGEPSKVCELFYERSDAKIKAFSETTKTQQWGNAVTSDAVRVTDIHLLGSSHEPTEVLTYQEDVEVRVRFEARAEIKLPVIGMGFHTPDLLYITTHESEPQLKFERLLPGSYEVICRIRSFPLLPGVYALRLGISEGIGHHTIFYGENLVHFQVVPQKDAPYINRFGFFELDAAWRAAPTQGQPMHVIETATERQQA